MDNDKYVSIFMESNENLGITFNSYKILYKIIDEFLNVIEERIIDLIDDPFSKVINVNDDLNKFKNDIQLNITPEPIEISKIYKLKKEIKIYRSNVDKILNRLANSKNKISFGGNWYRFAISRPKVYHKEVNYDYHEIINRNIRNINYGLDWIEKVLLDLYNMIDQDLNILTLINTIYGKNKVFESVNNSYIIEADIEESDKKEDDKQQPESNKENINKDDNPPEEPKPEESPTDDEPPELSETDDIPIEDELIEEPNPENTEDVNDDTKTKEPKPESFPKKVDKAESDKNGVRRKKLYIAFIEWCKEYNHKNTFGSIFDKDAFKVSYPFVPDEMRYFYRLANPMLCVLAGNLTFFPVAELRKINSKNSKLNEMMIFAATTNDLRVFNIKDKKVYRGTDDNGNIKLEEVLGDTYDTYIQKMINKGDILNGPIKEYTDFMSFSINY